MGIIVYREEGWAGLGKRMRPGPRGRAVLLQGIFGGQTATQPLQSTFGTGEGVQAFLFFGTQNTLRVQTGRAIWHAV